MDKTFRDKYKKKRGKETNKEKTGSFFFFRVVGTFFSYIFPVVQYVELSVLII